MDDLGAGVVQLISKLPRRIERRAPPPLIGSTCLSRGDEAQSAAYASMSLRRLSNMSPRR